MKDKINLLMIALKLDVGGLERMLISLMKGLDKESFRVTLCTLEDPGQLADEVEKAGIDIIPLYKKPGLSFRYVREIKKIIREKNIDIVHTHNNAAHWFGTWAAFLSGPKVKIIHTKHGRDTPHIRKSVIRNWLCSLFTDVIVPVSDDARNVCLEIEKVSPKKLKTIINGVDLGPYIEAAKHKKDNPHPVIGHVGRLYDVKNQPMLLRVFAKFLEHYPQSTLAIVGDGPKRQELEALADSLGITERVIFYGYRADIPELMAGFDWFTLTSHSEGTPLVVIEAMATKCPCISSNIGGLGAIIEDQKDGYLCPPYDEIFMLKTWIWAAENPQTMKIIGERAQQKAQNLYSAPVMTHEYQKAYRKIFGTSRNRLSVADNS